MRLRRPSRIAFLCGLVLCAAVLVGLWAGKAGPGIPGCGRVPLDRGREGGGPEPAPYLLSRPSPADGQGRVTVSPAGPFRAGDAHPFEIVYTVGPSGIGPGGFVLLQVSPWWGWSPPQTLDPAGSGYTRVETSAADFSPEVRTLPMNRILVAPGPRGFLPGETVTFRYGRDARVDRFAEDEERFQVFTDADGDGHAGEVEDAPTLRITAGAPVRLCVNAPSQCQPGEAVSVRLVALDGLGNWGGLPGGGYTLRTTRGGRTVASARTEAREGSEDLAFAVTPEEEGVYFFEAEGPDGLSGTSNVLLCQDGEPVLKRYFGDLHGHSRLSDGTGTPEAYYRYARRVSGLDFAALTDHADHGTIPIQGKVWERIVAAADQANEPGRFVTFLGFEWTNWTYGHRNVYYRDGGGPVCRAFDERSDTPQELWALLAPHEAMTVAHHVGGGPQATDWDVAPGPCEWLVEICSVHGSSEAYGAEASVRSPVRGAFVRDALARGYRLGIIGSGDTHDGHPGQRSAGASVGGLVGVYSPELTREALWEAFRRRQVYATSGPKILLHFQAAGSPMGSETAWPIGKGAVPLGRRAVGCDRIRTAGILRDGEPGFRWEGDRIDVAFLPGDEAPPAGTRVYYARIVQRDGNMAWSSPVWVRVE